MSKVIITGAGGFVGSELTKKFIDNGIEVIAMSSHFGSNFPQSKLIKKIETNIINSDNIVKMVPFDNYSAFYHLAWRGINGPDKANPYVQLQNSKITMSCALAAKQVGTKKFLCAGTIAERNVESLPKLLKTSGGMLYGVAKHCTRIILETYCKNIGLDFVWMQFSNVYGPKNLTGNLVSYTLKELIAGREAKFGPALQPYDFIFIDDLIEAVYRLGIRDTRMNNYFIGSGEPRILRDYLVEIGEVCCKSNLVKIGAKSDDGILYTIDMFDNSSLVSDIGCYVATSFREGIKYTVENYCQEKEL